MTCTAQVQGVAVRDGLVLGWLATPDGHLERVDDEFGADVVCDRPAHHAATERVEDRGEIDRAFTGQMFGHVHHPEPVWALGVELAADEIVAGLPGRVAAGAAPPAPPICALDAGLAHEPLDPFAGTASAEPQPELGVHPGRAIGAARHPMDVDDRVGQDRIGPVTIADRARLSTDRTRRSTPSSRDNTSRRAGPSNARR
jgi:hypothetical protein